MGHRPPRCGEEAGKREIGRIIWDCDGCLIDSEILACEVSVKHLSDLGYHITAQRYIERFAGKGIKQTLRHIEEETGRPFLDKFPFHLLQTEREVLFRASLKEIPGIKDILNDVHVPMCIASGSERKRLELTLNITGLFQFFEERIFSAEQVERGKPSPDLFLFAAEKMGVPPSACLVIEDSVAGIQAARSAGMHVFAFAGASHVSVSWKERLTQEGPLALFDRMDVLPALLEKNFLLKDNGVQ